VSATLSIWAIGLGLLPLACSLNAKGELYGRGDVTGSGSSASGASGSTSSGGGSTGMSGSSGTSGGGGTTTSGQGGAGGSGGTAASGGEGGGGAGGSGGQGGGPVELCGNGMIDPGEECDDQNGSPDDGCNACDAYCFPGELEEPTTHHCYRFETDEKTRDKAKDACDKIGLYLASITSQEELDFIALLTNYIDDRWIGGLNVNGVWTWDNGEPWGFTKWEPSQPNGSGVCLDVRASSNVWNDDDCTEVHDFICEWTPPGNKP